MAQKFAVYVRRSAKDELKPGERETSVEQQLRLCLDYAKRQGWTVPKEHVYNEGDGVTAYKGITRAKFDEMVAALKRREVDGVVVWMLNRASRNRKDSTTLLDLMDSGVVVASVVEGIQDPDSPSVDMHFMFARQLSRDISRHSRRGKESLALSGLPSGGGRRRFGFEKDGVTVIEHEAEILREAGRRALAGEGLNTICRDFNDRDLRMADGKSLWQPTALRRILLQPRTAGLRGHGGQGMEVMRDANGDPVTLKDKQGRDVEKILDVATWTRLGAVLRDPDRRKPGHPHEYLLSGIPTCRNCGKGRLYGRTPKDRGVSYLCSAKNLGCYLRIDGGGLDAYVTRHAIDWLCGDGLVRAREQLAAREADHEATKAQLAADEAKLLELADAYAADEIDLPSMLRARKPIEARITKAKAKLEQVPRLAVVADLPSTRRKLTAAWKRMPVASKRAILKAIIARFEVSPGTPGRHKFDESRVTLVFIDREQPDRKITWPISHDAGEREMFKEDELPHETDPAVLDMVAREMEEK